MPANITINQSPELGAGQGKMDMHRLTKHIHRQRGRLCGDSRRESSHFSLKEAQEPWRAAVTSRGGLGEGRRHSALRPPKPAFFIRVPRPLHQNHLGVTCIELESAGGPAIGMCLLTRFQGDCFPQQIWDPLSSPGCQVCPVMSRQPVHSREAQEVRDYWQPREVNPSFICPSYL